MSCSLLAAILVVVPPPAQPAKTGSQTIIRGAAAEGPGVVMVSLYRDGKLVRTRELRQYVSLGSFPALGVPTGLTVRDHSSVTWKKLPEGTYDVYFEARGFPTSSKRVCVSADDEDDLTIWVELTKKPYTIGDPLKNRQADKVRSVR